MLIRNNSLMCKERVRWTFSYCTMIWRKEEILDTTLTRDDNYKLTKF